MFQNFFVLQTLQGMGNKSFIPQPYMGLHVWELTSYMSSLYKMMAQSSSGWQKVQYSLLPLLKYSVVPFFKDFYETLGRQSPSVYLPSILLLNSMDFWCSVGFCKLFSWLWNMFKARAYTGNVLDNCLRRNIYHKAAVWYKFHFSATMPQPCLSLRFTYIKSTVALFKVTL